MKETITRIAYPGAVFLVFIALWQFGADQLLFPAYVLPAPSAIAARMAVTFWPMLGHALITTEEILCGFVLALISGVILALLLAHIRTFEKAFYPWLVFVQVLPKVALGPLLVVWVGIGFLPKALVSFLLAFFPVMIDTLVGLKSIQRDYLFLLRSMGATPLKRFFLFELPYTLPYIFASLKVAITLAAVGAIVGEFIGADKGLGYVLIVATGTLDTVLIFVALAWVSLLSLLLYAGVSFLERIFVSWHTTARHDELRLLT
jgi:NitT/TauT family transport system permease protein